MASDTATLVLDGVVPAKQFADAVENFDGLINTLTASISQKARIEWLVDSLEYADGLPYGSAKTTLRGEASQLDPVERVVRAYSAVGKALATGEPIPYSDAVRKRAESLMSVLNGKIVAVRFETGEEEWTVSHQLPPGSQQRALSAYGAIEGRVETLTKRRGFRFTLYDTVTDRAISCYLDDGQEEMIRGVWGKRAIVEGLVSRDPLSGRPTSIRRISQILTLEDVAPGSYRTAKGILAAQAGGLTPEEAIRQFRDGW